MTTQQQSQSRKQAARSDEQRQDTLQRVSDNDSSAFETLMSIRIQNVEQSGLDPRTHALVNLGALVALDADPATYVWQIDRAMENGSSADEVVGALVALAPTVGVARIVSAAPSVAAALDIEIDDGSGNGGDSG
ncbi:MAG: carboxymuconolactone decarboxylase family protein [Thermoleophilaceae bacterium]